MTDETGDADRLSQEVSASGDQPSPDVGPPADFDEVVAVEELSENDHEELSENNQLNTSDPEDKSTRSASSRFASSGSVRLGPSRSLSGTNIIESLRPTGGIAPPHLSEERRELRQIQASRDRRTDTVRGLIGMTLLLMLAFAIVAPWVSLWVDLDYFEPAKELFPLITTPLVGLIGAAMGFYFGERSTGGPSSSGDG